MADHEFTPEELENEEWCDIPGFPGYQASNIGRVRSVKITVLKSRPGRNPAYFSVSLQRRGHKAVSRGVHQVVALAFIGPRPACMLVNHKDTKKRNNRSSNLEYRTHQGNARHASENGLLLTGEQNNQSKLTDADVVKIVERLVSSESAKQICKDFPVSDVVIGLIRQNRAWRHIPRPASGYLRPSKGRTLGEDSYNAKLTDSEIVNMRLEHDQGHSLNAITKRFNIAKSQTWRIVNRKSWRHIS